MPELPQLKILSWNQQYDAIPAGRWPYMVQRIHELKPDILCLQECRGWLTDKSMAEQAARDLGMEIRLGWAPRQGMDAGGTAIAWRPGLELTHFAGYRLGLTRGMAQGVFHIPGLPVPLTVISAHVANVPEQALADVGILIDRARRYGGLGVIAGDINFPGKGDPPPPDVRRLQPHLRLYRFKPTNLDTPWEGDWVPNEDVAQRFIIGEMVDVAAYLADITGDGSYRAPTGVFGEMRVDQIHVVRALQGTIAGYGRVDPRHPAAPGGLVSDHWGVWCDLDLNRLSGADLALLQEYH